MYFALCAPYVICRVVSKVSFLFLQQADFVKVAHPDQEFREAAERTCIEIGTVVEK